MAEVTIVVPDAHAGLLIDAICERNGYEDEVLNPETGQMEPNPEGRAAFARRTAWVVFRDVAKDYRERHWQRENRRRAAEEVNPLAADMSSR